MKKPKLMVVPIDQVIKAKWNYKTDGTQEQIEKLMKSIERDMSAGVLATREIKVRGKLKYEVMDGNHRLEALRRLKWKKIPIENFGEISKAKAVTITRRRNHSWFDDDLLKISELMAEVTQEIEIEELATFMPEDIDDLENLVNFGQHDWVTPESKVYKKGAESDEGEKGETVPVQKNKVNLSIRLDEGFAAEMGKVAEKAGYTNLEEFALFCIKSYVKDNAPRKQTKKRTKKQIVPKRKR